MSEEKLPPGWSAEDTVKGGAKRQGVVRVMQGEVLPLCMSCAHVCVCVHCVDSHALRMRGSLDGILWGVLFTLCVWIILFHAVTGQRKLPLILPLDLAVSALKSITLSVIPGQSAFPPPVASTPARDYADVVLLLLLLSLLP